MQYMLCKRTDSASNAYSRFMVRKTFTITNPILDAAQHSPNGPTTKLGGTEFATTEESYFTDAVANVQYPQKFWWCFSNDESAGQEWQINSVSASRWYWAKFYSPQPIIMQSFGIDVRGNQYHPAKIRLYGSQDDSQYTLISNEQVIEQKNGTQNVSLTNNAPYRYFKLEVLPKDPVAVIVWKVRYEARTFIDFIPNLRDGIRFVSAQTKQHTNIFAHLDMTAFNLDDYEVFINGTKTAFKLNDIDITDGDNVLIHKISGGLYPDPKFSGQLNISKIYILPPLTIDGTAPAITFNEKFAGCSSLSSVPMDLLYNNPQVTSFQNFFNGTNVTSVPVKLLSKSTALNYIGGFFQTSNIETVPGGVLKDNKALANVLNMFLMTPNLKSVPEDLFANNPNLSAMHGVFNGSAISGDVTLKIISPNVVDVGEFNNDCSANFTIKCPKGSQTAASFKALAGVTVIEE